MSGISALKKEASSVYLSLVKIKYSVCVCVCVCEKKKKKEASRDSLAPLPREDTARRRQFVSWKRALTRPRWHPDLGPPVSRTMGNTFLLFTGYPVCGILLQQPERTQTLLHIKLPNARVHNQNFPKSLIILGKMTRTTRFFVPNSQP